MITYIPRSKLEPHPDNPRKALGDLSELTASIRKQGLLQNLTVVPSPDNPGKYRIVIGHRRFNASAAAGIQELPCIIDEKMTYPEQIAVMMSENIQRSDLTIAEKAGGVQMMMDLGMNAVEIAGNTGISDSTVRRYAKIGKLSREGMTKAEQRGATLMQFMEISEIEDEALRLEALAKAGTNEYNHVMFKVRTARDRKIRLPIMVQKLSAFAQEIPGEDYSRYMFMESFAFYESDVLDRIDRFKINKNAKYAYCIRENMITLYMKREQYDDAAAEKAAEARRRMQARANHEREIAAKFKEMRDSFMADLSIKGKEYEAQVFVLWVLTRREYLNNAMINGVFDRAYLAGRENAPTGYTGSISVSTDEIYDLIPEKKALHAMVLLAYDRITRGEISMLDRYSGTLKQNDDNVKELYWHLSELGYPISDEEEAWMDGTHECFSYPHDEKEGGT